MPRRCLLILLALPLFAADLELTRPARAWEFFDATGTKSAILGKEDGTFEAWIFPLKILKDFKLSFLVDGRRIPGDTVARSVISRPGSFTVLYSSDEFRASQTFIAPPTEAAVLVRIEVDAKSPVRVDASFERDFQLMWPASIGTSYLDWDEATREFRFGADGQSYAAVLDAPGAILRSREYGSDFGGTNETSFSFGILNGHAEKTIVIAGSLESRDKAQQIARQILADPRRMAEDTERYYRDYLAKSVQLQLPAHDLQQAYEWSLLSMRKALVDNPLLGAGLVAGYGPSKGTYRPGYGWFFGRDSFWTTLALTASGDFATARQAIGFVARYQRFDGKIPHEIAQSASLVPWFDTLPWAYSSADATPLFIIAAADYMTASADVAFIRELWPRLTKAMSFMRSTYEEDGFARNLGVGHGWIEGGPMLPVRTEFYQAGLAVEALRSYAILAKADGDEAAANVAGDEYKAKKERLEKVYWLPQSNAYAFAIGLKNTPVDQPGVLQTVPMWFGLTDREHSKKAIAALAEEEHAADWGMRIISNKNEMYHPAGYHFGSIWPLFTGWASVGEYRYHEAAPAFANLQANARLALDGSAGHTTEVLSGDFYSPLSTSSSHQTWSAAMVVSPLLRGLFGLEVDAIKHHVQLKPHLPADWNDFTIHNIPVDSANLDVAFHRLSGNWEVSLHNSGQTPIDFLFSPALSPRAAVQSATLNGTAIQWRADTELSDSHATFSIAVPPGDSKLTLRVQNEFGYTVQTALPQLGQSSSNLKVISEQWSPTKGEVVIVVAGLPDKLYTLDLFGTVGVASVEGGQLSAGGKHITLQIPGAEKNNYTHAQLRLHFTLEQQRGVLNGTGSKAKATRTQGKSDPGAH